MQDAAIERYVYDDMRNGMASLDGGNVALDFRRRRSRLGTTTTTPDDHNHGRAFRYTQLVAFFNGGNAQNVRHDAVAGN